MPELWFGPDRDPDYMQPILPLDALEALNDVGDTTGVRGVRDWNPAAMGFAAIEPDHGDALAAAMGGLHLDETFAAGPIDLDDLIDPWSIEADVIPVGFPRF
jgi:hypothetical protein